MYSMVCIRSTRTFFARALIIALVSALLAAAAPGCGEKQLKDKVSAPATSPAAGDRNSFSFIVCGDPQNNYEIFNRVLEAARQVDFLIIAGDLTGSGTGLEFQNFVRVMNNNGTRYYAVPGNHDVATSPVTGNYTKYIGRPYGSFSHKNCYFVLIDNSTPELGFYPEEREWVAADLKRARAEGYEHYFAVCHVPPGYPYSAKADRSQIAGIDANHELIPILAGAGVEELFCGHVHGYYQNKEKGMLVTITGGAGAPLMGSGSYHHYVRVDINGKKCEQKVIPL